MGFSAMTPALAALLLAGTLALPGSARESIPGPPLPGAEAGAFCAIPAARGPWNAAFFGAAVVAVGAIARRRGARA